MIRGDRPAPTEGEIEITPEMIEAGVEVFCNFHFDFDDGRAFVVDLFKAMELARRRKIRLESYLP
jgi:hypothetical protein